MDILHHGLIGIAGYHLFAQAGLEGAGMAFVAGSVLPDIDIFYSVFGKRFYLKNHQKQTHSVVLAPLFAVLPAAIFASVAGFFPAFFAALLGILLHLAFDYANTFGISLFYPLSKKRFCSDFLFFIDAFAYSLTIGYLCLAFFTTATWPNTLFPMLLMAYLFLKYFLHRHVVKATSATYAVPSSYNPLKFYIYKNNNSSITTYEYNAMTQNKNNEHSYPSVSAEHQALAQKSCVYQDMLCVTKALEITSVLETQAGTTIEARDLAVRNFGGKFGHTKLEFNTKGELTHEVANI